jgi:hypothetical protein
MERVTCIKITPKLGTTRCLLYIFTSLDTGMDCKAGFMHTLHPYRALALRSLHTFPVWFVGLYHTCWLK